MTKTYRIEVAGVTRELPLIKLTDELTIASFVMLGDAELNIVCAEKLAEKLPKNIDFLVTAEAKGIPLVQELSHVLGFKEYFVARKSVKPYMEEPLGEKVFSITTQKEQTLYLDGQDAKKIAGKKIALVDDVISTGESLATLKSLVEKAGGEVIAQAAVLAEGDAAKRTDIIFLEELPLF